MDDVIPRLKVTKVSKSYPGCLAIQNVDLCIYPGEIHALLGENGAGKSTLMKIIYGVVHSNAGKIEWEGRTIKIANPTIARNLGISMVFQHFSLFETLTVTENIALTVSQYERWHLKKLAKKIQSLSEQYGLSVNPNKPVYTLSVGERQRVEIIRCLLQSTRLLILDEPTSVLTPQESDKLFAIVRQLAQEGCSVLFSSHKLQEVQALCNQATVLRGGQVVAHCQPKAETPASLARLMIGTEMPPEKRHQERSPGAILLRVNQLTLKPQHRFGTALSQIQFELYSGEIVGIAGVAGNGQAELLAALSGEYLAPKADMIQFIDLAIGRLNPAQRRRFGLAYAPEDRLHKGVVPHLGLAENALLTGYGQGLVRRGIIQQKRLRNWTEAICEQFQVKRSSLHAPAQSLSGGNLQKFIMGREMLQQPKVLITAHPTWGVDVHATVNIHDALISLRDAGTAVLVLSEDLDELLTLCDRIGAISKGMLSEIVPVKSCDIEALGRWMGGMTSSFPSVGFAHAH